mgnify:CR=1 FL=1
MGLFTKNKKEDSIYQRREEFSSLSELPKLPELPTFLDRDYEDESISQLPSFPANSLGDKFSQDAIKEAITGRKEGDEVYETNEFPQAKNNLGRMQRPLTREIFSPEPERYPKDIPSSVPEPFREVSRIVKEEPIFIRIDKFEESLETFWKIKAKLEEIEKMLKDTKRIKEEEEKELTSWEEELQKMKLQIEKVDRDIFSKIE